jgi:hypothetical protein
MTFLACSRVAVPSCWVEGPLPRETAAQSPGTQEAASTLQGQAPHVRRRTVRPLRGRVPYRRRWLGDFLGGVPLWPDQRILILTAADPEAGGSILVSLAAENAGAPTVEADSRGR